MTVYFCRLSNELRFADSQLPILGFRGHSSTGAWFHNYLPNNPSKINWPQKLNMGKKNKLAVHK